jgi:hypothetical protein
MDRPKTQKAFKRIQEACQLIARNARPGVVVDTLFTALREFDDALELILPGAFQNPSRKASNSIVAARAALQSLQWSMYRISMLKLSRTKFRYMTVVTTWLARIVIPEDDRLSLFDKRKTQLEECLDRLDQGMQQVFPRDAPYSTSLFVELHGIAEVTLLPPLGDEVTRSFCVL